jgi:hypothetical protein
VGRDLRLLGRPAPRRTLGPPPNAAAARVIGDLDRVDVYGTADRAQVRLGKQVNPVIWTPDKWVNDVDSPVLETNASPRGEMTPGGEAAS